MKEFGQRNLEPSKNYYQNRIELEQEKLHDFFTYYLPDNFRPNKIMDFCCGVVNEEKVLFDIFGDDLEMVSFDSSEMMMELASKYQLKRKSLIKLNISEVDNYFQEEKFDLLIGRNIPISSNGDHWFAEKQPDYWPEHMSKLDKHLSYDGYLLMTFARDDEFYRGIEILSELDFDLILKEENKIIVPSDHIGIAGADIKDNFVILAKKVSKTGK